MESRPCVWTRRSRLFKQSLRHKDLGWGETIQATMVLPYIVRSNYFFAYIRIHFSGFVPLIITFFDQPRSGWHPPFYFRSIQGVRIPAACGVAWYMTAAWGLRGRTGSAFVGSGASGDLACVWFVTWSASDSVGQIEAFQWDMTKQVKHVWIIKKLIVLTNGESRDPVHLCFRVCTLGFDFRLDHPTAASTSPEEVRLGFLLRLAATHSSLEMLKPRHQGIFTNGIKLHQWTSNNLLMMYDN